MSNPGTTPALEELLATCIKDCTRVSDLEFAKHVAFLLVPLDDAIAISTLIKEGKKKIDAAVMLHYREDAGGKVRYLFADFTVTIDGHFNQRYRILVNDNIPFFEALADSAILAITPSEVTPQTQAAELALIQMPKRDMLEELLAEIKSKVGPTLK